MSSWSGTNINKKIAEKKGCYRKFVLLIYTRYFATLLNSSGSIVIGTGEMEEEYVKLSEGAFELFEGI